MVPALPGVLSTFAASCVCHYWSSGLSLDKASVGLLGTICLDFQPAAMPTPLGLAPYLSLKQHPRVSSAILLAASAGHAQAGGTRG